jgi:hypothetical protein
MSSPEPMYSEPPPPTLKDELISRDGPNCYLCRRKLAREQMVIDHIIPKSRGGIDSASNRAIACVDCDKRKFDYLLSELEWVRPEVKAKYAALEASCARRSNSLLILLKRIELVVIIFTITPTRRLDSLISIALKQE